MQKAQIRAGVLYGYASGTSDYRHASPVIVLDAKSLWTWGRSSRNTTTEFKVSNEKRYTAPVGGWSSYYGCHGYLVLTGTNWGHADKMDEHLAQMKELYQEFAATAGNPDAVNAFAAKVRKLDGFGVDVVNNRWITGGYEEAKNEEAKREAARQAKHKAERDRSAAEHALLAEVAEAIGAKLEKEVSVHADRGWGYTRASVKLEDLAAFFGLKTVQERL